MLQKFVCRLIIPLLILIVVNTEVGQSQIPDLGIQVCDCGYWEPHTSRSYIWYLYFDGFNSYYYEEPATLYSYLQFSFTYLVENDGYVSSPCQYGEILAWTVWISGFGTYFGDYGGYYTENFAPYSVRSYGISDHPSQRFLGFGQNCRIN